MSVTDGSKYETAAEKQREMEGAAQLNRTVTPTHLKMAGSIEPSDDLTDLRVVLNAYIGELNAGRKSRERSLVVTKLQEAEMWAMKAVASE